MEARRKARGRSQQRFFFLNEISQLGQASINQSSCLSLQVLGIQPYANFCAGLEQCCKDGEDDGIR